jgi:hypothetical protein
MDEPITLTVPSDWLKDIDFDQTILRQALQLGLDQLREQQSKPETLTKVIEILIHTGLIRHLTTETVEQPSGSAQRQTPPHLPGMPVSEVLIAQRRGDL